MDRRLKNHKWYDSFDESTMHFTLDREEGEMLIPADYVVCGICDGRGKYVNPSIDSNGISQEDFDNDPDFREDYFSGMYDVVCGCCDGKRVAPEIAWERLKPEDKRYLEQWFDDERAYQAECEMERKMGC